MSPTAVVILNYNGEKLLRQFIPSVVAYSPEARIIIADNASTDRSVEILTNEFPQVGVVRLDQNYGFCGGYNRALQQIKAEYYVLLNSDVEVTPNWLQPLITLLDQDKSIAAVQPKVLSYSSRNQFEYAGAGGGLIDTLGYPFCRGRILSTVEEDKGQFNDTLPIFWATGACIMLRSELYHRFHGLDEDFFAHMEEIDLCWKMQRAGYKIYYSGESTVYHLGAGTLGYANPKKTYLNFRNGLTLLLKHFDGWELFVKLPCRIVLDWVAALMFLTKGELKHANAILTAHVDFFGQWSTGIAKRRDVRKISRSYPRTTIYNGLILLQYYLLGKKTYRNQ
jgi:GT2 family glycosyltransferase